MNVCMFSKILSVKRFHALRSHISALNFNFPQKILSNEFRFSIRSGPPSPCSYPNKVASSYNLVEK